MSQHREKCYACLLLVYELKQCARCHAVSYCSTRCQRKDWAYHKKLCRPPPSSRPPAATPALEAGAPGGESVAGGDPAVADSAIATLPPELLCAVLLQLPVCTSDDGWRLSDCRLVSRTWYHQVRSPAVNRRIFTGRWGLYAAGLLRPTPLLDVGLTWNGCLAVGPGGEVVTATEDSGSCDASQTTIKVWTDAAKPPRRFNPGWGQQDDVAISDDRLFSFGGDDTAVNAWSLTDGRKLSFPRIPRVAAPTTWAYGVDVDTRRRRLFTVMRSVSADKKTYETLDVFSFDGEYEKRVFELEAVGKGGIAVMVDGLVAHAARGGVMLWNPDDGSCTTIKVTRVSALAPAPDGRLAIGALASITIWSPSGVASSTSPMETKGHIKSMACLSDSTLIAAVSLESSSSLDERFQVWSTDSLTLLATIHTAPILQTLSTRSVRLYDQADLVTDVEASHTGYVYTLGCASFTDITRDTDVMDATFVLKW